MLHHNHHIMVCLHKACGYTCIALLHSNDIFCQGLCKDLHNPTTAATTNHSLLVSQARPTQPQHGSLSVSRTRSMLGLVGSGLRDYTHYLIKTTMLRKHSHFHILYFPSLFKWGNIKTGNHDNHLYILLWDEHPLGCTCLLTRVWASLSRVSLLLDLNVVLLSKLVQFLALLLQLFH